MTEKEFLESSLLEEYALGLISDASDIKLTEDFLASSNSVQSEFELLQNNIEKLALSKAVKVPAFVKDALMTRIDRLDSGKVIDMNPQKTGNSNIIWRIAAGFLILISSSIAVYNWSNGKELIEQNENLTNQIQELEGENGTRQDELNLLNERFAIIADPSTAKIQLRGNEKASDLNIIAYRNNDDKASYLHIVNLPKAPEGKCFQLWGDVDGEMISLGVLTQKNMEFVSINHLPTATSLNITMEKDGGSDHATVTALVASAST